MKEYPILFKGPMVCKILDDTKTQTRRPLKPHQYAMWSSGLMFFPHRNAWCNREMKEFKCPYGMAGDRLWVRETWARLSDNGGAPDDGVVYRATDPEWQTEQVGFRWRPAIHMPCWASRLLLDVIDIRVELACDISEEDVIKEGFNNREEFFAMWDRIYPDRRLWSWVIEFKRNK